jgi:Ribbon-helix-helix protein, copG family
MRGENCTTVIRMGRLKREKQPARLTVTLDERDYSEVCQLAERNDVSAAWVIRRAVQQYLRDVPRPADERS